MLRDQARLASIACLLLVPVTACSGTPRERLPAPTAASSTEASPTATPPTGDQITGALLPQTTFRGYHRFGPSSGSVADLMGVDLAAAVGMPHPAKACAPAARTLAIDPDKAGKAVIVYPYAEVTYVRGAGPTADLTFETIAALSADVPPDATGIKVPADCKSYTTQAKGLRTTVTVQPLAAGGLPHIQGANVTGLRTTMDFGAKGRIHIDTVSIRSASRLILVAVGGKGDVTKETEKMAITASTCAHDRLGMA